MPQGMLTSTGLVLHDLGLAVALGGNLFGKMALDPAVKTLQDPAVRGKVAYGAWKRYSIPALIGTGTAAATWATGRVPFSGKKLGKNFRGLVIAKDVALGTCIASGFASVAAQTAARKSEPNEAVPMNSDTQAAQDASDRTKTLHKITSFAGYVNVIATAAVMGITSILVYKAGESRRWKLAARVLP